MRDKKYKLKDVDVETIYSCVQNRKSRKEVSFIEEFLS